MAAVNGPIIRPPPSDFHYCFRISTLKHLNLRIAGKLQKWRSQSSSDYRSNKIPNLSKSFDYHQRLDLFAG
jgi:hypothetical protein